MYKFAVFFEYLIRLSVDIIIISIECFVFKIGSSKGWSMIVGGTNGLNRIELIIELFKYRNDRKQGPI